MSQNPLRELHRFGVSLWYDNISRGLLASGEFARLVREDGVRGVTSNPTIFEKAIGQSHDYDSAIQRLAKGGLPPQELFEHLAIEDIRAAADLLKPVYDDSDGQDGFVSIELPPALARDAAGSHAEAVRLHKAVGRDNVMIKIPGTAEGLRAIEETIAGGIPVNVTLLFSRRRYAEVAEAYLRGLERRAAHRKDLSRVASVASFFVSRVDTAVDKALEALLPGSGPRADEIKALLGRAAIANAKLAYQVYKRRSGSPRFEALRKLGARPQRLVWASTGTKNPLYRDVLYVEELIGQDTVNTMPPATLDAFRAHGACRPSLEEDVLGAIRDWEELKSLGIDLAGVEARLEEEGLEAFAKSYETLMGRLAAKRELVMAEEGILEKGLAELKHARFSSRLWRKDASLWRKEKEHQKVIKNSLGWLTVADAMAAGLSPIRTFAAEVRKEGFRRAVVLGMGGSSLACEVFRTCFPGGPGWPVLDVLDSTNPSAISALEGRLDLKTTLFIVSSKSGSTIEPNCFLEYFFERVARTAGAKAGRQFAAITDPGTSLETLARSRGFRRVFTNPPDIGGRFSALSYFGLVPAAVMGVDIELLLTRAREAARSLSPSVPTEENQALRLGAALGLGARDQGQDKLTLSLPPSLEAFGLWVEQLVAESTGKEGKGILPVTGEPLSSPESCGQDRLFVRLSLPEARGGEIEKKLASLERAGHPVLWLSLRDPYDLGAQFLVWEVATAAAGFLLGVNPFDQPDVQAAKDRTNDLLGNLRKGALPVEKPSLRAGGLAAHCDGGLLAALKPSGRGQVPQMPLAQALAAHLGRLKPGDYCALIAYLPPSDENRRQLDGLQSRIRALTPVPVTVGWGPRYLHSTGQLYKGGAGAGLFLVLTEPETARLPIPGKPYTFGTLHEAQARGDFAALVASGRRALRLELGPSGAKSLQALANALDQLASDTHAQADPRVR